MNFIDFTDYMHEILIDKSRAESYLDTALEMLAEDPCTESVWLSLQRIIKAQKPKSAKWEQSELYTLNVEEVKLLESLRPYGWKPCANIAEFKGMAEAIARPYFKKDIVKAIGEYSKAKEPNSLTQGLTSIPQYLAAYQGNVDCFNSLALGM